MRRGVQDVRRRLERPAGHPTSALRAMDGHVLEQAGTSRPGPRRAAPGHRQEAGEPMPSDERIFSLRLPHALAARLEQAKAGFGHGELSMGEVTRRLLAQRLEQLEQHAARRQARDTLQDMLAKWRGAMRWTPAEWQVLVAYATQAYLQAIRQGRSVVDRAVLSAVMQASETFRTAASPGTTGAPADTAGRVHVWAAVPPHPTPDLGVAVCQQLATVLHAVPPAVLSQCQAQLTAVHAPLLQLAMRGYWSVVGTPVLETPAREATLACFPLTQTCTAFGHCLPLLAGPHLRVVLTCTGLPLALALRTAVDWLNLVTLVEYAHTATAEGGTVRTALGRLSWAAPVQGPRQYQMTLDRWQLTLSGADFAGLAALVQQAMAQPDLRRHLEDLSYMYGRL
jgi:hypothetical protein